MTKFSAFEVTRRNIINLPKYEVNYGHSKAPDNNIK